MLGAAASESVKDCLSQREAVKTEEIARVSKALIELADIYRLDDKKTSRVALRPLMMTSRE